MNIGLLRDETRIRYCDLFEQLTGAQPQAESTDLLGSQVCKSVEPLMDLLAGNPIAAQPLQSWLQATPDQEEKLVRAGLVAHMFSLAFAYMQDKDKAFRWLAKGKAQFAGYSIFDQLSSPEGFSAAEKLVLQMGEGIVL